MKQLQEQKHRYLKTLNHQGSWRFHPKSPKELAFSAKAAPAKSKAAPAKSKRVGKRWFDQRLHPAWPKRHCRWRHRCCRQSQWRHSHVACPCRRRHHHWRHAWLLRRKTAPLGKLFRNSPTLGNSF